MKRDALIVIMITLFTCNLAFGQAARNGTNAASELMIPIGARYLGGGGAAAMGSGIEGILWNPASFDQGKDKMEAQFTRREYIADIGVNFAGIGIKFENIGGIAATLRSFDIGEIDVTDEFHMDGTGEVFEPTIFILGLTYSKRVTDRIRVGVTGNVINEDIAAVSATGYSFDAGVQYDDFLNFTGLSIGVAIRNIGTDMKYDGPGLYVDAVAQGTDRQTTKYKVEASAADMPTVIDLSANYVPMEGLNVGLTYSENNYGPSEGRALVSYNIGEIATLRASYMVTQEQTFDWQDPNDSNAPTQSRELESIFTGPSFGGSLNLEKVIGTSLFFDYGFIPVKYFDSNHIFTFRFAI